jgi:hypothetical protein
MIAWLLVTYGITLVITGSKIAEPFRKLMAKHVSCYFFSCPMCVGFWVGLALTFTSISSPVSGHSIVAALGNAFASSAACWSIHVVLAKLGAEEL